MARSKTVQGYLDETPNWADGTPVASAPMTTMQWRIWFLATAGKFFEGLVVFITGVALPLIQLEFDLSPTQKGMVGAAVLFGILIGATALGSLADHAGRKRMFIIEMALFTFFLLAAGLSTSFPMLVISLVGVGLALGCDYPTAHMVISESIPSRARGRLVLGAFGFQAVGALVGTLLGFLVISQFDTGTVEAWRMMYLIPVAPAVLVVIGRFFVPRSAHWLVAKGRVDEAESELSALLHRKPPYPGKFELIHPAPTRKTAAAHPSVFSRVINNYRELFSKKYRRATILASVPWFLQDLSTYGIGIFTPIIIATTFGAKSGDTQNLAALLHDERIAARGAAMIDLLLLAGIIVAILFADKIGRIRLQVIGFVGCAAGLLLASLSAQTSGAMHTVLLFVGFMLFNFMTNMGPNAMTYLLAGEVYPTRIRGAGAGFAASFAKMGAVLTAFLFPILLADLGTNLLLYILIGTSLLGAVITCVFAIETKGRNLEELEAGVSESPAEATPAPVPSEPALSPATSAG